MGNDPSLCQGSSGKEVEAVVPGPPDMGSDSPNLNIPTNKSRMMDILFDLVSHSGTEGVPAENLEEALLCLSAEALAEWFELEVFDESEGIIYDSTEAPRTTTWLQ